MFMKSLWKVIERDGKMGKWSLPYVSLSPDGEILITRVTWEKSGSPAAYLIMFDDTNQRIGLKATGAGITNAYKAYANGNAGSKKLKCRRLLVEHGIKLKHGLRFTDIEITKTASSPSISAPPSSTASPSPANAANRKSRRTPWFFDYRSWASPTTPHRVAMHHPPTARRPRNSRSVFRCCRGRKGRILSRCGVVRPRRRV